MEWRGGRSLVMLRAYSAGHYDASGSPWPWRSGRACANAPSVLEPCSALRLLVRTIAAPICCVWAGLSTLAALGCVYSQKETRWGRRERPSASRSRWGGVDGSVTGCDHFRQPEARSRSFNKTPLQPPRRSPRRLSPASPAYSWQYTLAACPRRLTPPAPRRCPTAATSARSSPSS